MYTRSSPQYQGTALRTPSGCALRRVRPKLTSRLWYLRTCGKRAMPAPAGMPAAPCSRLVPFPAKKRCSNDFCITTYQRGRGRDGLDNRRCFEITVSLHRQSTQRVLLLVGLRGRNGSTRYVCAPTEMRNCLRCDRNLKRKKQCLV